MTITMEPTQTVEMKMVLVGNQHVGKTCIVRRAITGQFKEDTVPTLGASYSTKEVTIDNTTVRMQIWDTAGQEKYRAMAPMYYHNAQVALVVYAIDDRQSFEELDKWMESLAGNSSKDIIVFIVANKQDLADKVDAEDEMVSPENGKEKAAEFGAEFAEVSAVSGYGIGDLFSVIPRLYLERRQAKRVEEFIGRPDTKPATEKKPCC